ncbi:hypothetical protein RQP46_009757 [Phenoliferia psychrophenolica]
MSYSFALTSFLSPQAELTSQLASLEIAPAQDGPSVARAQQRPSPQRKLYPLEGLPLDIHLIGREDELERTFDLLATRAAGNTTGHVALVGLGGIGKTSVATKIAHDSRSKTFGRPAFIRCKRLDTLDAFQWALLRLRAPRSLEPDEDLEEAVRVELTKEPLFLVLDNLLDSTNSSHNPFLDFIYSIGRIPTLTLLITSRNHTFDNHSPSLPINIRLVGLSDDAAEELFRNEYARVESDRVLQENEPGMAQLLGPLDGIPLAVVLVAAHARKSHSLADIIRRWKDKRAWNNGVHGRLSSLETSLALSFDDKSLEAADAITLLYILAGLPDRVPRHPAPPLVHLAMEAAVTSRLWIVCWKPEPLWMRRWMHIVATRRFIVLYGKDISRLWIICCKLEPPWTRRRIVARPRFIWLQGMVCHWLQHIGHLKVVDRLLQAGVAVDARADDGWNALHQASENGMSPDAAYEKYVD